MIQPNALQQHIISNYPVLANNLADIIECLQNHKFPQLFDAGLWFSPKSHITIIYTSAHNPEDLADCWFQIGAHGKISKDLTSFKGKYSSDLTLSELDIELSSIQANLQSMVTNRQG